jgi:hypothetical protein
MLYYTESDPSDAPVIVFFPGGGLIIKKPVKRRISVTVTETYLSAMDRLVEEGIYLSRGEIILEAIRRLLKQQGIEPFHTVKE